MNQEKETTKIVNSAGEYLAPKVKVIEIKARRVMCVSETYSNSQENDLG